MILCGASVAPLLDRGGYMSAYQVLYRKYRPRTFDDVVGQPQVTKTLKNELLSGRINHAYLFTGTRGTGKTSCAKILSKAVNCISPVNGEPCGECEICRGIDSGDIFDVIEMDAASNRRIDDIRDITEKLTYTPERCKYRVYIIDEVHMLTNEAFNALLKTLEEPPEHVIFILATTEVHKLPATILSRCQRFDFHRISAYDMAERIKYVTSCEDSEITDEAALLVSVIADGAVRDALSLLDRCLSLSSLVDADIVRRAAGLAGKDHLLSITTACVNKNSEKAISMINKLYNDSKDMSRLCDELISHYRSLMLIKTVRNPRELLIMSDSEYDTAYDQAQMLSLSDIVYAIDTLQAAFERMGRGSDNRIELEIALVKLSAPELDSSIESLFARISALEKAVKSGIMPISSQKNSDTPSVSLVSDDKKESAKSDAVASGYETLDADQQDLQAQADSKSDNDTPAKAPKKITAPSPAKSEEADTLAQARKNAQSQDIPKPRNQADMDSIMNSAKPLLEWPDVVANLSQYSKTIGSAFEGTTAYVSGDYLLIDAKSEMPFKLLQASSQRDALRQAVREIIGKSYKLGPYKPPKEQETQVDPLDSLTAKLRENGINIIEQ